MTQTSNEAVFTMILTPAMEKEMIDLFNIETEIIQGSVKQLPDGRKEFEIIVRDEQKIKMIKSFMLMAIAASHNIKLN